MLRALLISASCCRCRFTTHCFAHLSAMSLLQVVQRPLIDSIGLFLKLMSMLSGGENNVLEVRFLRARSAGTSLMHARPCPWNINAMADATLASDSGKCQDVVATGPKHPRCRWSSTHPNKGTGLVRPPSSLLTDYADMLTSDTRLTPFSRCECSFARHPVVIADHISTLFVMSYVFDELVTPFMQHFALTDTSLQYPYTNHERVPVYLLIILTGLCPAIVVSIYALLIEDLPLRQPRSIYKKRPAYDWRHRFWEVHSGVLAVVTAQGFAYLTVTALKNITGKPRPDLIARCLPRTGANDEVPFGLLSVDVCTQEHHGIVKDGVLQSNRLGLTLTDFQASDPFPRDTPHLPSQGCPICPCISLQSFVSQISAETSGDRSSATCLYCPPVLFRLQGSWILVTMVSMFFLVRLLAYSALSSLIASTSHQSHTRGNAGERIR
jgi:hypothetical protein